MRVKEVFERLVGLAVRRPLITLALVLVLAAGGGALALSLQPSTGTDTFVSRSAATYRVTADDQAHFGGDPVVILIRESLPNLVLTRDLGTLTELEACLAGQTVVRDLKRGEFVPGPAHATPYGGWRSPCGGLARLHAARVVYGPGTFLNRAVGAVDSEVVALEHTATQGEVSAARQAYTQALHQGASRAAAESAAQSAYSAAQQRDLTQLETLAEQSGLTGLPKIDDPNFITAVVFDQTRGVYQPKARLAYLFPTANSALVQVRLRASLTPDQQARAIALIRRAVRMPMFASAYGATYTVSGAPVVLNDLSAQLTHSIAVLLIAAVVVMAIVLLAVFHSRLRLLPLLVALAATGITFGCSALVGASLTMASIAVLPVLIGLAVDYAVQFQSRVSESDPAGGPAAAVRAAGRAGAPTIAVAALATAVGFLVLLLSPVPMVRSFALLLVLGIAVALVCALTAGSAALVVAGRGPEAGGRLAAAARGARDIVVPSLLGARELLGRLVPRRARTSTGHHVGLASRWRAAALGSPGRVLAVGAVLAVLGWAADTQTAVQSDVTKLVPAGMPALRDLRALERVTGVSGEIDVVVHARDVATPQTIGWMIDFEQRLFRHYGYVEARGCAHTTICPALSLPDLFATGAQSGTAAAAGLSRASIDGLLSAVPAYFRQAVITPDRREATLAFGIHLMPLERQQEVIGYMRSQLHPPAGVSAGLAGLPVLAAQADAALSSSARRLLTLLAGLVAVGLALGVVFRDARRVLVPLAPIVLATGWSALILFAIRIPLNPMSATLGALVIAISTEFSVLLSERYRQQRRAGHDPARALRSTYRSTGRAVLVSGVTAIAGFGVLVFSNITMLRDFGFVTLVDLTVSLGGVLLVLPAVLALSERSGVGEPLAGRARALAGGLPRPRRRPRVA